jgi:hypothetical protein
LRTADAWSAVAGTNSGKRRVRRLALTAVCAAAFWILAWFASLSFDAAKASQAARYPHDWGPLPSFASPSATSHIDPRLSRIARTIAGRDTEVRCWSEYDWIELRREITSRWSLADDPGPYGAFTSLDRERINLSPPVCGPLEQLVYRGLDPHPDWDGLSWAVSLLSHESMHVSGIDLEAAAECYGVQRIPATARTLGIDETNARILARRYWSRWYLTQDDPEYRSPECRDGGRLDLHPESNVWP